MRRGRISPMAMMVALFAVALPRLSSADVAPFFAIDDAAPGADFHVPTAIAFFPDGRLLVTEKTGRAWVVQDGIKHPTPLWDATTEILENGDRGLVGVAVDPHYALNHFVYFSYVVDPDSDGVDNNDVAFGRVTRYRTSDADSNVVDPASRTVLLGATWASGVADGSDSHTIDALRWGEDGSLLVSTGEGALYSITDAGGLTPNLFLPGRTDPYEDIGSFRAQSVSCLGGKILRIDPANGQGYASNPYFDGNPNSSRSKVWAYGLRNPWRFCVRPGTGSGNPADGRPGTLYVGNVGLNAWEALCVARQPGANFGWPCYEGPEQNAAAYLLTPAHNGCGSMGTPDNPAQRTPPTLSYHHADSTLGQPPGFVGNAITGGAFYTGAYYPPQYQGALFFADYGRSWIKTALVDSTDGVDSLADLTDAAAGPVDFAADPLTGDLYFVSIYENTVKHIRYTTQAGNLPPIALASGTPRVGAVPLPVGFTGTALDIDGDPITFQWNFGDGEGSALQSPTHVYSTPGSYASVMTADDGRGGIGRDTVSVVVTESAAFPTSNLLDDFNRPDGPLGPAWVGGSAVFSVLANRLGLTGGGAWGLWDAPVFGPNEEVYYTFATAPTPGAKHNLYLKVQGTNLFDGSLRVGVDPSGNSVTVSTYEPETGWRTRGGPYAFSFAAGDRFGARAYENGAVQVLKNGVVVATAFVDAWPFHASEGRIGLEMGGGSTTLLDDFGGGDAVINGNLPPSATITSPVNATFYTAGDTIRLHGTAADDRDSTAALRFRWDVDLNHNNHVHPDIFVATTPDAYFVAANHDDGTGVSYHVRLTVTDSGGLSTVKSAQIWPDVDLWAPALLTDPDTVTTAFVATYRFWLRNAGKMPAPISHWRIVASNGVTLAQGDTIMAPGTTVTIQRVVPPMLAAGTYTLRVRLDTLGTVHETSEDNNARVKTLVVKSVSVGVGDAPAALRLSGAYPNPSDGEVTLALDLPRASHVAMRVFDVQGREIWSMPECAYGPGRWSLAWPGRTAEGRTAHVGLYLARVEVDGQHFSRRIVLLR